MSHLLAVGRVDFADPRLLWATGALMAALLVAAGVFAWLDRWRKRQIEGDASDPDPLTPYRELYDAGELSRAEYEAIRAKLAPKYLRGAKELPSPGKDEGSAADPGGAGGGGE